MTVGEALEKARSSKLHAWPVIDERGLIGMVRLNHLQQILAEGGAHKPLSELVESHNFPHLHADQPIPLALERMAAAHVDALPVVSRADVHKLEGILVLQDVLALYGVACQGPG
jgi:chloride channel protein, CIC family